MDVGVLSRYPWALGVASRTKTNRSIKLANVQRLKGKGTIEGRHQLDGDRDRQPHWVGRQFPYHSQNKQSVQKVNEKAKHTHG